MRSRGNSIHELYTCGQVLVKMISRGGLSCNKATRRTVMADGI